MLHKVTITALGKDNKNPKVVYEQVTDHLDMQHVIYAVNTPVTPASMRSPAPPRKRNRTPKVVEPAAA